MEINGEINLDDWQKEVIDYEGNIVLCTGRQVGKTLCLAIKCSKYLVKHPKSKVIICSLTEEQAKLIIVMILDYLEKHYRFLIARGKYKPILTKITLKNKAQAIARPVGNTGDAIRGFTGDVLILDEVSRFSELIMTAAKPTLLTTGGQIWMCSTPFGKQGYFYECFLNKAKRFKIWHKSSEEVIHNRKISSSWSSKKREGAIRILEEEKKEMSEIAYGQEYLGLFLDELRRFFSDELIESVCVKKRRGAPKDNNYLGVDIARMGDDETTFEIISRDNRGMCSHVENITKKKQLTTETERNIIELNNIWKFKKIGIDAGSGSLGVGIFDRLMQTSGIMNRVVAMNNRQISVDRDGKRKQRIFKEDMYDNLRSMMENREILLLDDENLKESLRSIQIEFVSKEKLLTKARIFGSYSHIVEGLIRASWLAKKEKHLNLWVRYS